MHTTLEFLKASDACTPGFGRMLRFFGTRFDRNTKIPLHVVALVGGFSDAEWTLGSALIIDYDQYAEFRNRTLPLMMRRTLLNCEAMNHMRAIAWARKLPFATKQGPYRQPSKTTRDQFVNRFHADLWHVLGFDNENLTPPPIADVEEFIRFICSIPSDLVPSSLLSLVNKPPLDYIKNVFKMYRTNFIDRDGEEVIGRYLFVDEVEGSDGYILAKILQPVDTLKFMSSMDYKPRMNFSNVEQLPGGKVRVSYEMDIESLEYLSFIRQQSGRETNKYRDQDKIDDEVNTVYPRYSETPVVIDEVTGVEEYQELISSGPVRARAPRGRVSRNTRVTIDDEEEEEDPEEDLA